jgi:tRNA(Leu) C34 or U34 (ribose-2'-O)-methylase TrmL
MKNETQTESQSASQGAASGYLSAVEVHDRPSQQSASWSGGASKTKGDSRGFACIGLHEPKCEKNIGAVLRACGCYEAEMIVVAGKRYHHAPTDTQKTWRHIPLIEVADLRLAIPKGCVVVAVDLIEGARPLTTYVHPERAFYVFGGEDRTLGPNVLSWCRDVVYVPTAHCMNLAATVNVVLYDRLAKRGMRVLLPKGKAVASEGRKYNVEAQRTGTP